MRVQVPVLNKGDQSISQVSQASKVRDAEPLALQVTSKAYLYSQPDLRERIEALR
jgi:hypothetical protein